MNKPQYDSSPDSKNIVNNEKKTKCEQSYNSLSDKLSYDSLPSFINDDLTKNIFNIVKKYDMHRFSQHIIGCGSTGVNYDTFNKIIYYRVNDFIYIYSDENNEEQKKQFINDMTYIYENRKAFYDNYKAKQEECYYTITQFNKETQRYNRGMVSRLLLGNKKKMKDLNTKSENCECVFKFLTYLEVSIKYIRCIYERIQSLNDPNAVVSNNCDRYYDDKSEKMLYKPETNDNKPETVDYNSYCKYELLPKKDKQSLQTAGRGKSKKTRNNKTKRSRKSHRKTRRHRK